ncbi:MAG: threonylcarbamoyl-AMP synthase [Saprospiraceae bacterium]|nr:threonylcarbamoyl-AMP synthase [Saprospiraceae bacterium]
MNLQHEIDQLTNALNNGEIILYPTQTIWGLGCDASNETAVQQLLQLKNRPVEKGLIVLVDSLESLKKYINYIPPKASNLIEYHTRPLTIIYEQIKKELFAPSVCASDGSLAIRVTLDPFCKQLLQQFGKPIVSTSANFSQAPYPKSFADIDPELSKQVAYVADYKREKISNAAPSTIVKVVKNELLFIRKDNTGTK